MGQDKTILLVEDDAIIALIEIKWLTKEGFEVIHALSGESAIETVKSSPAKIDLILMDIDLGRGNMDGTEAAEIILKDHDIPLLFLSSHTEKEIVEKTETISSYGYVVKGSDNTVLLASIKMAFKLFSANQRLAESKEFFEQMYLQSATSTQILDAEGWCVRINPKLSELFGVRPEDIEGKVYNIFNDEEIKRNGIDEILRRVFEKKESAEWEVHFDIGAAADSQHIKVEQKTKVWFKNNAWPILDKNGKLVNVIIQHENISEIKQMEELLRGKERRLRNNFKAMSEGFAVLEAVCDEKGKARELLFLEANPAFLEMTGLSAPEITGSSLLELFPAADNNWMEYCAQVACTGEPVQFEARLGATADQYFQVSAFQIENFRIGILLRDASLRRKTEEQLKRYAEELKAANETKDKYFSILAYDLKGPFNGFLGLTEDLKNNLKNLDDNEISEYAFILNSQAKRIYELLINLLDWSRLQSQRMEYHPVQFNICNEIQNIIGLFYPAATAKSIFITNEVNIHSIVYADQNMISTILRNLLSNSIKFTNEGGRIRITSKHAGSFLEISVSDSGIGIDYEVMDRIFRLDSLYTTRGTNNEGGSGLGLVLCKELVKKNGGEIRVESILKKGTTFTFSLPLSLPE